jgi:hypothetical protein
MNTLAGLHEELPFACEIHCPKFNYNIFNKYKNSTRYKVFINSTEPQTSCQPVQDVINKHKYFDLILTKTPEIIKQCSNAKLFLFGDTWVKPTNTENKNFSVSFLCSVHINPNLNYNIREELWNKQNNITIPKRFWSSNKNVIDAKRMLPVTCNQYEEKLPLFESMFSISLENSSEINYFSEKIIDCFLCKTIPIYWGCPNIGDYFNLDGIIIVNSIDDLIHKCNNLTPEYYYSKLAAITDNYNNSLKYFPIKKRIQQAIIEHKLNHEQS